MVLGSIIKSVGKVGSKEGERKEIHQTARDIRTSKAKMVMVGHLL